MKNLHTEDVLHVNVSLREDSCHTIIKSRFEQFNIPYKQVAEQLHRRRKMSLAAISGFFKQKKLSLSVEAIMDLASVLYLVPTEVARSYMQDKINKYNREFTCEYETRIARWKNLNANSIKVLSPSSPKRERSLRANKITHKSNYNPSSTERT